jgi:hypothetical protein
MGNQLYRNRHANLENPSSTADNQERYPTRRVTLASVSKGEGEVGPVGPGGPPGPVQQTTFHAIHGPARRSRHGGQAGTYNFALPTEPDFEY